MKADCETLATGGWNDTTTQRNAKQTNQTTKKSPLKQNSNKNRVSFRLVYACVFVTKKKLLLIPVVLVISVGAKRWPNPAENARGTETHSKWTVVWGEVTVLQNNRRQGLIKSDRWSTGDFKPKNALPNLTTTVQSNPSVRGVVVCVNYFGHS